MFEKLGDKALDVVHENSGKLFDLFMPGMQNIIMDKRLENAERAIENIKARLAKYGLEVDYKRYFEEKLQVPLMTARGLSEVQTQEQRDLLQELFLRHLTGQYKEDAFYPSFIQIIETLTPLEIKLLKKSYEYLQDRHVWYTDRTEYEPIEIPRTYMKEKLGLSNIEIEAVIKNLERNCLLFSGADDCMYITALGILFMNACIQGVNKDGDDI